MARKKARPEVLGRHLRLLDEVLSLKGLSQHPLVELFALPGRRGLSHSGGIPAFSEEEEALFAHYRLRSGEELSAETEARMERLRDQMRGERRS